MVAPLRELRLHDNPLGSRLPGLVLGLLVGLPLAWVGWVVLVQAADRAGWQALTADPQWHRALQLTLWTGLASTGVAVGLASWLLSRAYPGPLWSRVMRGLAPMLAVPHAAFAIGLLFLLAPSGWLLRLLSPWATGLEAPPPWPTSQDPLGLGLILALVAKEVPFLLWTAAGQLQRPELARRWTQELQLAASMGYSAQRAWWRVLWPQLWPRMGGPVLAVLAYSLTVVDMALVIGPAAPPTLSMLSWAWLNDVDPDRQRQGAAAAWTLGLLIAALCAMLWPFSRLDLWRERRTDGVRGPAQLARGPGPRLAAPGAALAALYVLVMSTLLVSSLAGPWPFPQLWPQSLSLRAWASVWDSAWTIWTSLLLALTAGTAALIWSVLWLEFAPRQWDTLLRRLLYLPLLLPSVLWVWGLHALALHWGIDARWSGLWLAHTLACLPYVLLSLSPSYLGFDARHAQLVASLGHGRWALLARVKWPLLKAAIAASFAIGFAVSVAQYLPTLYIGAGRFATVTTEAVAMTSGGQRALGAAYAWLQWLLPMLMFGLAAWLGRPRRFHGAPAGVPA